MVAKNQRQSSGSRRNFNLPVLPEFMKDMLILASFGVNIPTDNSNDGLLVLIIVAVVVGIFCWRKIVDEKNTGVAVIVGAVIIVGAMIGLHGCK
jgi:hypothetical protein